MSIVLHWKARERRPFWRSLPGFHAFALRPQMQGGDTSNGGAGARDVAGPSDGENAAFDAFFARYEGPLYGYLRRMLPSHDAALDVAQEAFFRAWQRFDVVSGYDRPQAWLFRVATNLALDTLRRRQPIGFTQLFGDHDSDSADEATPNDALPALIDPADMEQSLAARDLVNQLLLQVTPRQRAAVLLWAKHGLTMTEIAEALETTEVNVRQLLSRGRARFRALYDREINREIQGM